MTMQREWNYALLKFSGALTEVNPPSIAEILREFNESTEKVLLVDSGLI